MLIRQALCISASIMLSGCGTTVPQLQEPWEDQETAQHLEFAVKANIFCELVSALKYVNNPKNFSVNGRQVIPDDYGVQLQIDLSADEITSLNGGGTYNRTYRSASIAGVTIGQILNLGGSLTLSSDATRTDSLYSFYQVGRISAGKANEGFCSSLKKSAGSSPLLESNLKIQQYLSSAAEAVDLIPSSPVPKGKKDAKFDIFTYVVKFIIVSSGGVNPVWKLANVSGNTAAMPLISSGRTRIHTLTLTLGPTTDTGVGPSIASLSSHFDQQIVQSNNSVRQQLQP